MTEAGVDEASKRPLEEPEVEGVDAKKQRTDEGNDAVEGSDAMEVEPPSTSQPVTVGYRTFENGAALHEYYQGLHSKLRSYQNLNDYEFHMVLELIKKGHPDAERKLAGGVAAIQLQNKEYDGRQTSCFHLIRPDGSVEDVSYRKCIASLDATVATLLAKEDGKKASPAKAGDARSGAARSSTRSGTTRSGSGSRGKPRGGRSGGRGRGRGSRR
ncbi:hypothetical protein ACKKBG_A15045 [Auxenochlorella protothecoides x Auxenochlorella symbiontica]